MHARLLFSMYESRHTDWNNLPAPCVKGAAACRACPTTVALQFKPRSRTAQPHLCSSERMPHVHKRRIANPCAPYDRLPLPYTTKGCAPPGVYGLPSDRAGGTPDVPQTTALNCPCKPTRSGEIIASCFRRLAHTGPQSAQGGGKLAVEQQVAPYGCLQLCPSAPQLPVPSVHKASLFKTAGEASLLHYLVHYHNACARAGGCSAAHPAIDSRKV